MENTFVKAVTDKIKNKRDKTLIAAELESHILDKTDYYIELGYDKETAIKKATEDMGEPDDTALPLRALSGGAGKDWFFMLSIIYLVAAVIVPFFFHKFNYADSYYQAVYHLNIIDFVSMVIIFCYALILILAFKTKSKRITLLVVISLLLSNFNGMVIFRPAVYPLVKIITSGFGSYIDSIFAYSYFTENLRAPLTIGSYTIFAILIIWAAIQWTAIFMQERMRNTKKLNKIILIVKRSMLILLCANSIILSTGTIIAFYKLPEKKEQAKSEKQQMLDFILDTGLNTYTTASDLEKIGYKPYYFDNLGNFGLGTYYLSDTNNCLICSNGMISYSKTNYDSYMSFLSIDDVLTREQTEVLEKYREYLYDINNTGFVSELFGINELKDNGIYQKAIVFNCQNASGYEICSLLFFATTENGQIMPINIQLQKYNNEWIIIDVYYNYQKSKHILNEE